MKTPQTEPFKLLKGDEYLSRSRVLPFCMLSAYLIASYFLSIQHLLAVTHLLTSVRSVAFFFFTVLALPLLVLTNVFYFLCYTGKFPSLDRFKLTNVPWPWIQQPAQWKKNLPRLVFTYLFNYFILGTSLLQFSLFYAAPRYDLQSVPSFFEYFWQLALGLFVEDFFFYWSHRILHHPMLYKRIHKKHHEFYNTICVSGFYAHPVEFIIGNYFPSMATMLMLKSRMHVVTWIAWINFKMLSTHDAHSGYDFDFSFLRALPSTTSSVYHNYHHLKNSGNFGSSFRLWDSLFGTNEPYKVRQMGRDQKLKEQ